MPANLENSAVDTGLEKVSFHSNPKERQCQRMLKLLHNCTHLNGYPLQCSCLENPRTGEPDGLPSLESHRVRHDWYDAAAAFQYQLYCIHCVNDTSTITFQSSSWVTTLVWNNSKRDWRNFSNKYRIILASTCHFKYVFLREILSYKFFGFFPKT